MYRYVTIPQSKIKDFCQPPLHKGAFSRPLFVANYIALCYDKTKGGAKMEKLFSLTFYTQPNSTYRDAFQIGFFRNYDEAKKVEEFYRKEVPGFKDYPCDAEITEVPIIGPTDGNFDSVYRYVGWNINEGYDEIDIIESHCYTDHAQAENDYKKTQLQIPREEWALNLYRIGERHWQEGFVRETY